MNESEQFAERIRAARDALLNDRRALPRARRGKPDRTDEGARRLAQQRELMRRLLEAGSTPTAPEPEGDFVEFTTPLDPPEAAAPTAATALEPISGDAEAEEPNLRDAITALLAELAAPMTVSDIVEWLAESGIEAEPAEVSGALGELGGIVSVDEDQRWTLAPTHLDAGQQLVAFAPLEARMLVVAGPGAGKTEVACARVANAINSGVNARSIILVSFTRAATAELKERIGKLAQGGIGALRGVQIRTLDSLAWTLQRNLTDADLMTGSYTDNIARCIDLLADPPAELSEYFDSLQLVVIDEAQDFVGLRSELAVRLLNCLPAGVGVTVFADPAQAIYGDWALDEGREHGEHLPLHERINAGELGTFDPRELEGMHRTDDTTLRGITNDLRTFALVRDMSASEAHEGILRELVERVGIGDAKGDDLLPLLDESLSGQFFLFRTHGEVAQLSSYLSGAGMPHRLRFPGLPQPVYPWIGRLLGEWEGRRMRHAQFEQLWTERVAGSRFDTGEADAAWEILLEVAEDDAGRLDVLHLREILARRSPPDEVVRPTLGERGPVLGTIHGSKGREAEDVVLGLTAATQDRDHAEEARVLYVGATRAKQRLRVAEMRGKYGYLQSRRVWRHMNRPMCALLEFGLEGDVDPVSPVDREVVPDADSRRLQDMFASSGDIDLPAYWRTEPDHGFKRLIRLSADDRFIGLVGHSFVKDMWSLGKIFDSNLRPGDYQRYLYVVDYTTVARDDDSPDLNRVTDTFARSGFWVAPLVKGQGGVCMNYGRRSRW